MIYSNTYQDDVLGVLNTPVQKKGRDDSRRKLIRAGAEMLCEQSYASMGVDHVLLRAGLTKGSFYHFFPSKEEFVLEVIAHFTEHFNQKLDRTLTGTGTPPLERIRQYIHSGEIGMARFEFRRGCLIGNLSHEVSSRSSTFRDALDKAFKGWEDRIEACLKEAVELGELSRFADTKALAEFFWTGWEGALIRAKVEMSSGSIIRFAEQFFTMLPKPSTK